MELVRQWGVRFPPSVLPPVEIGTTNSIVIMQNATFTGNITHAELVKAGNYNGKVVSNDFVAITIAVDDSQKNSIRVKAGDSNGLLKAHQNGEVLKGLRVVISGVIDLAKLSECSHYTSESVHKTRKNSWYIDDE